MRELLGEGKGLCLDEGLEVAGVGRRRCLSRLSRCALQISWSTGQKRKNLNNELEFTTGTHEVFKGSCPDVCNSLRNKYNHHQMARRPGGVGCDKESRARC